MTVLWQMAILVRRAAEMLKLIFFLVVSEKKINFALEIPKGNNS